MTMKPGGIVNGRLRHGLSASAAMRGIVLLLLIGVASNGENWPGWRGPRGDGTSSERGLPTQWSGVAGDQKNIRWQVEIPGKGHVSPIVWNDRVFVATCLEDSQERVLLSLDRDSGRTIWKESVLQSPLEKKHTLNSFASSTPVTDGTRVYVTFLKTTDTAVASPGRESPGVMVVAAYDFDGNEVWRVEPGEFSSMHGY